MKAPYESAVRPTALLPGSVKVKARGDGNWTKSHSKYFNLYPDNMLASIEQCTQKDFSDNVFDGRTAGRADVEIVMKELSIRYNDYWWNWLIIPIFLGLPMETETAVSKIEVVVRNGDILLGKYEGSGKFKWTMSLFKDPPKNRYTSAIPEYVLGMSIESAMRQVKSKIDEDYHKLARGMAPGWTTPAASSSPLSRPVEGKLNIAVADLNAEAVSAADAAVVADWLRGAMVATGAFTVVEKKNMDKILAEQAFQQTGCTSEECAVKLGKVLNVKQIVVGSLGKYMGVNVLNVRVVDVETGAAVYADKAKGSTAEEMDAAITVMANRMAGK